MILKFPQFVTLVPSILPRKLLFTMVYSIPYYSTIVSLSLVLCKFLGGNVVQKIIRLGVIGAGAVASSVYLPILSRRSDLFELVAISDFNVDAAQALAHRFAIPHTFDSPEAMISSGLIDATVIINSGTHCDPVVKSLNTGLDVFCEKPLAYTREEMELIEGALTKSGKKLMIGYMKTFDQAVTRAASLIDSRPRTVDVIVLHPSGESQLATSDLHVQAFPTPPALSERFSESARQIQVQALGADAADAFGSFYTDVILGSVIHELSVLRSLDLHITEIDFVDHWPRDRKADSVIINARTADGVRITIRWFYLDEYPLYQEEIRWVNDQEGHHIVFPAPYILRVPTKLISTHRHGLDHSNTVFESYMPSFEIELVAFHELVLTGKQQGDPIKDGSEDLRIGQQIAAKMAQLHDIPLGGNLKG